MERGRREVREFDARDDRSGRDPRQEISDPVNVDVALVLPAVGLDDLESALHEALAMCGIVVEATNSPGEVRRVA